MKKKVPYSLFAVVSPGLEEVCLREMRSLGLEDLEAVPGGVSFTGDLRALYSANLWLRAGSRVLARVGEVHARDFPEFYRKCLRLPWGRFVRPDQRVQIRASSRSSRLFHTGRIGQSVSQAIDHALGREPGFGSDAPLLVLARFEEDVCTLSVDSSGELLHRRGYRREIGPAPLRETLAAGVLEYLGWRGQTPLFDPTCGSGTFPIEAALIALGRPPGLDREFAFSRWPGFRPGLWDALRAEWRPVADDSIPWIGGTDILESSKEAARANARRAQVLERITFERKDFADAIPVSPTGLLVCNPPYGARIGAGEELLKIYCALGNLCRERFRGWDCAFLCPDQDLARMAGREFSPRAQWTNGGIPVKLFLREKLF